MALQEYKRSTDAKRLVQDSNVEVYTVFYPPHFEEESALDIGDSDPNKEGALATFKDGTKTVLAVYQGGGVWEVAGGDTEYINNESLSFDQTSTSLNGLYPDMSVGGQVYSEINNVIFTKISDTKWRMGALDLI